jgi:hypothetical protein
MKCTHCDHGEINNSGECMSCNWPQRSCQNCLYNRMCRHGRNILAAYESEQASGWVTNWQMFRAIWIGVATYCGEYIAMTDELRSIVKSANKESQP